MQLYYYSSTYQGYILNMQEEEEPTQDIYLHLWVYTAIIMHAPLYPQYSMHEIFFYHMLSVSQYTHYYSLKHIIYLNTLSLLCI